MASKFTINKGGAHGDYFFNLKAADGEKMLGSPGYTTKTACKRAIDIVRVKALDNANYEKRTNENGQPYFVLKAENDLVIGTSEPYLRVADCERGIEMVKSEAPVARVDDISELF